ncbi:MAG: hypothetical protein HY704_16430 [Gemmatimonadetes bacterium]|nr:hypothetical protein [Gemmatimonadota bacterium]
MPDEALYSDVPEATTILGAGKLTGKTESGWAFGVVDAVTAREEAPYVHGDRVRERAVVEPLSNYFAARVRRELRAGQSAFGAMFTAVNRALEAPSLVSRLRRAAYAGGIDFRHEWARRTWSLQGYVAPSYISGSPDAIFAVQRSSAHYYQRPDAAHLPLDSAATSLAGYAARLDVGKRAGLWQSSVQLTATSPGYEVNDLGFQTSADRLSLETSFSREQTRPGRVFRRWSARTGPDATWNYAGELTELRLGLFLNGQFLNYWGAGLNVIHNFETYDDRLTRGGPLAKRPPGEWVSGNLASDFRRPFSIAAFAGSGRDRAGGRRTSLGGSVALRPAETWEVRLSPNLSRSTTVAQYVDAVTDPAAAETFGRRYVFADLEQTTLTVETRLNVTFTPDLSIELYAQPLLSTGDYGDLKEFRTPGTFTFAVYGKERGTIERDPDGTYTIDPDEAGASPPFEVADRDFNFRSLRGNAVLRWEWRPGSTLFLVWQQSRSESLTSETIGASYGPVARFDLMRDAKGLVGLRPDNIFLIKLNFWWNP